MAEYMESLQHLAEQFGKLEGVGRKTAMRLAYSVVDMSADDAIAFADAIRIAKERIHLCPVCQNLTDRELCPVCRDENRGVYHVLHGLISPMNGVGPEQIKIRELLARIGEGEIEELIVATNPTIEGEATAMYIARLVKPLGIKVTRLAYGIPVGADLEYADEVTLCRALEGRRSVEDEVF